MRVSKLKRQYLKTHFRRHSDAKLAKALDVDKAVVRETRDRWGMVRDKADEQWYRDHPDADLPPFTGQLSAPPEAVPLDRWDFVTAAFTALAALLVYLRTLGPTVTGEDSGELITAAYTMGIAHPPGYPLWCLLGKLFTFIPLGSIPWRVNLLSAVLAAATVFFVCLIGVKLTRNRLASAAGALAFAFSCRFWGQSVIAEMNSLNALFVALCIFLLFQWYETRRNAFLYAFAVAYGFGLTNHHTMYFLGPPLLAFVFLVDQEPWRRWKLYLTCLVISLLPLSIYVYLPLRAATNPPANWGNPSTLENFWDVVTRKQYQFGFTKNPRTGLRFAREIWAFIRLYGNEFTPWLALLPPLGALALWKKNRFYFAFLVALCFYITLGFIFVLNFDIDKESLWVNNKFWIPSYMLAGLFIGAAIDWLSRRHWRSRTLWPLAALVAAAGILIPLGVNYRKNDMSQYYFARDYAVNMLKTLDQNAIYIPAADHATFPVLYLQAVEGLRPDISIGNKYGYPEQSLYTDMPEDMRNGFRKIPTAAEEAVIEEWIIAHTDRPVYFTKKRGFPNLPDRVMVNAGLAYKVVKTGEEPAPHDYWSEYEWHTLDPTGAQGDLTAEFVLSDYHFALGRDLLEQKKNPEAVQEFNLALTIAGETKEGLNNVGSACAEHGLLDEAMDYYARTLKLDPNYDLALRNLGKIYFQRERYDLSVALFDRIRAKDLGDYEANWLGAQCLERLNKPEDALERLRILTEVAPNDDKVFREIGLIFLNQKHDAETARRMLSRSLTLNPNQPDLTAIVSQAPQAPNPENPLANLPSEPGLDLPTVPTPNLPQTGLSQPPSGLPGTGAHAMPGAVPGTSVPAMPNKPGVPQPSLSAGP